MQASHQKWVEQYAGIIQEVGGTVCRHHTGSGLKLDAGVITGSGWNSMQCHTGSGWNSMQCHTGSGWNRIQTSYRKCVEQGTGVIQEVGGMGCRHHTGSG